MHVMVRDRVCDSCGARIEVRFLSCRMHWCAVTCMRKNYYIRLSACMVRDRVCVIHVVLESRCSAFFVVDLG